MSLCEYCNLEVPEPCKDLESYMDCENYEDEGDYGEDNFFSHNID